MHNTASDLANETHKLLGDFDIRPYNNQPKRKKMQNWELCCPG